MTRSISLVLILLVVAGLLLATVDLPVRNAGWNERDVTLLKRVFEDGQLVAGRLVNRLQSPVRADAATPAQSTISRGPARPGRTLSPPSPPDGLRTEAALRLAQGHLDQAILTLEAAVLQASRDAASLNDLSAALLTRAREQDSATDLLRALDAANQALAAAPNLPEALYNRAEALTRVHLRDQARKAWEAYWDTDSTSLWANQARKRLRDLSKPTLAEIWDGKRTSLERAARRGDSATVQQIVARFPQAARLWTEEKVLPAWGAAYTMRNAERATGWLTVARQLGAAFTAISRDALIQDAVTVIDEAETGPADRRADLAKGLHDFGVGMDLYYDQKIVEARPLLASARKRLARAGSPFRGWAELYGAICDHYEAPAKASMALSALRSQTDPRRYPILAGRAEWILGTIANNLGQPEEALRRYRAAFSLLDASVGPQFSNFVHVLFAETYTRLGETSKAWSERLAALDTISRGGDPRRQHAALNEAAENLLIQGMPGPALEFAEELRHNAEAWGKPVALAEAYLQHGRALGQLGRTGEALQSLQIAERHANALERSGLRDKVTGTLAIATAERLAASDPGKAAEILGDALATQIANGYYFQLTQILTTRARAYLALGDTEQAEDDLRQALEEYERIRGGIRDEQLRLSAFERAQEAFDEMLRLQADHYRNAEEAFAFAERSRSRMLLDLILRKASEAQDPGQHQILGIEATQQRIPEGVRLIEYAVLPDRLFAWTVGRESLRLVRIDISATDLAAWVAALRNALERSAPDGETRSAAAALYEILIRPLASQLPEGTALVVVPDRFLARVPFAVLFDERRGRYLLEDYDIALAPSSTLYVKALERRRPASPWSALVVGNPAFDRSRYLNLPRLASADAEAAEIASFYPGSDLLRGEAATREAFLETAGRYRLVHFAGHALFHPSSPRFSRLVFAPGGESDSGALYAHEIAHRPLADTEIVVLSACSTLDGDRGGRESLTGLAASFLAAGPSIVVAGLWNADDRATRALMLEFHKALHGGNDPATALRTAQLRLANGKDPALRSPALWAGFEVVGGAFSNVQNVRED